MVDERISRAIDNDHTAAIKVSSDDRKLNGKKNGGMFSLQNSFFICAFCKKAFKNHLIYRKHLKIHSDKAYICQICSKGFAHKHNLHNHMAVHSVGKNSPFQCPLCPKRFSQKGNLNQHLKFHASKKPFKCEICKKEFYQQEHLRAHVRHHNNERPFQCEVCNKSFNIKSSLQRHMNCHTGAKPFICDICNRGYTRRSVLMLHIQQVHENKKPYQCSECQTCFSQKGNLQAHFRRKHLQPKVDNKRESQKARRNVRKPTFKSNHKSSKTSPLKNGYFVDIFSKNQLNKTSNIDLISVNGDSLKVDRDVRMFDNPKIALHALNSVPDVELAVSDHELISDLCISVSNEDTNHLLSKLNVASIENGELYKFLNNSDEVFGNSDGSGSLPSLQDTDSVSNDQISFLIPEDMKGIYEYDITSDPKDWEDFFLSEDLLNPLDSESLCSPAKTNPLLIKSEPAEDQFLHHPISLYHDYASPLPPISNSTENHTDPCDIPSSCSRTSPVKKNTHSVQVKKNKHKIGAGFSDKPNIENTALKFSVYKKMHLVSSPVSA